MYNAQHYIDKFTPIPDNLWCVDALRGTNNKTYCAQGHCMGDAVIDHYNALKAKSSTKYTLDNVSDSFPEWGDLRKLFETYLKTTVGAVNNANDVRYLQLTPKQRILKALEDIEKIQTTTTADTIIKQALEEVSK